MERSSDPTAISNSSRIAARRARSACRASVEAPDCCTHSISRAATLRPSGLSFSLPFLHVGCRWRVRRGCESSSPVCGCCPRYFRCSGEEHARGGTASCSSIAMASSFHMRVCPIAATQRPRPIRGAKYWAKVENNPDYCARLLVQYRTSAQREVSDRGDHQASNIFDG